MSYQNKWKCIEKSMKKFTDSINHRSLSYKSFRWNYILKNTQRNNTSTRFPNINNSVQLLAFLKLTILCTLPLRNAKSLIEARSINFRKRSTKIFLLAQKGRYWCYKIVGTSKTTVFEIIYLTNRTSSPNSLARRASNKCCKGREPINPLPI